MRETVPLSGVPGDGGPFDVARLTRASELDRGQAERDPDPRVNLKARIP